MIFLSFIGFVITIAILVTFHEWGHFYFARLFGIHVKRFSVGFGKPLKIWTSKKHVTELGATEYAIAAIPLGGFVQMAERPPIGHEPNNAEGWITGSEPLMGNIPPGLAFQDKPAWQRAMVVAAGPLANFLLAVLLFAAVYMIGNPTTRAVLGGEHQDFVVSQVNDQPIKTIQDLLLTLATHHDDVMLTGAYQNSAPETLHLSVVIPKAADPMEKYGILPWQIEYAPVIGGVIADTPAENTQLQIGDQLQQLGNATLTTWSDIGQALSTYQSGALTLTITRDGDKIHTNITPMRLDKSGQSRWVLGIHPHPEHALNLEEGKRYQMLERHNPITALGKGLSDTWRYTATTVTVLKQMLMGQQSLKNLGGPLTIADAAGNTLANGLTSFIVFLGIVSLSLGFLNLLPIPVLDGGHLALMAIEAIIGRPISPEGLQWYYRVGLVMVGCLTILALTNDVLRLLS